MKICQQSFTTSISILNNSINYQCQLPARQTHCWPTAEHMFRPSVNRRLRKKKPKRSRKSEEAAKWDHFLDVRLCVSVRAIRARYRLSRTHTCRSFSLFRAAGAGGPPSPLPSLQEARRCCTGDLMSSEKPRLLHYFTAYFVILPRSFFGFYYLFLFYFFLCCCCYSLSISLCLSLCLSLVRRI